MKKLENQTINIRINNYQGEEILKIIKIIIYDKI